MKVRTKRRRVELTKYGLDFDAFFNHKYYTGFYLPKSSLNHFPLFAFIYCIFTPIDTIMDKYHRNKL